MSKIFESINNDIQHGFGLEWIGQGQMILNTAEKWVVSRAMSFVAWLMLLGEGGANSRWKSKRNEKWLVFKLKLGYH